MARSVRGTLGILGAALILVCPVVGAENAGILFGTEEFPELPDDAGDVYYTPGYSRTGDYADLTGAWFEYDETTDAIVFTIRTAEAETLARAPSSIEVNCQVGGDITRDGERMGHLSYMWRQPGQLVPGPRSLESLVMWDSDLDAAGNAQLVDHAFNATLETPAYFIFQLPRPHLLQFGDALENPAGFCSEEPLEPTGLFPSGLAPPVASDNATSAAAYSFDGHRRIRSPDGKMDPIEEFERGNSSAEPNPSEDAPETGTPGFLAVFVVASVVVVASVFRTRRSRD